MNTYFINNLAQAIQSWKAVIGLEKVLEGPASLNKYKQDTFPTNRVILAVLIPSTVNEIAEIVKIASEYNVPLYPISKGNNWGYGSANPVVNGCVIVDLAGMDQITDFDPDLGIVTVEPGVTQALLADFLKNNKDKFFTPTTGAGPEASILGNALERGYGLTPIADHFQAVLSLEAVLPDGSIYHSPMYENGCKTIDQIFKWGIGPYLDGLFSQGNFGIVTKMTIQLAPRPEKIYAFLFEMEHEEDLENAVTLIKETLREFGAISGSINLMNSLRLLSMNEPYPFDKIKENPGEYIEILKKMAKDFHFSPWTCLGCFYGKKEVVNAAARLFKVKIVPYARRLIFFSDARISFFEYILKMLPLAISRKPLTLLKKLKMSLEYLEGKPTLMVLPLCYRKLPKGMPDKADLNPARDGCGLIWYSPFVPMKPGVVRSYVKFVYDTCIKYRMEPLITLTSLSDRCFDSTVPILFNPQDAQETKLAKECFNELFKEGAALGFYPYRANIDIMKEIVDPSQPFWAMQKTLKDALDPKGIISPGRYSVS